MVSGVSGNKAVQTYTHQPPQSTFQRQAAAPRSTAQTADTVNISNQARRLASDVTSGAKETSEPKAQKAAEAVRGRT